MRARSARASRARDSAAAWSRWSLAIEADAIASEATASYRARTSREPTSWLVSAADGAGPDALSWG